MQKFGQDPIGEETKNLISEFNEAKFQIWRLHVSWLRCKDLRRNGDLVRLRWELDDIWDELSSKALLKEQTDNPKDNKYHKQVGLIDKAVNNAKNASQLYTFLRIKERFLKYVQEQVGMGGKFRDLEEEGMDI